jgi:hypothetical protein
MNDFNLKRRTFLATMIAACQDLRKLVAWEKPSGYPPRPGHRSIESIIEELGPVPRPEHPQPDLFRPLWYNLNGVWEFAYDPSDAGRKENWKDDRKLEGRIIVPFCPESQLSGVYDEGLHPLCWYARSFDVPEKLWGKRIKLHFGAVDYRADVWLNGTHLGQHVGGYDLFDFDVTALVNPTGNRLVLRVDDDMHEAKPRGKQSIDPHGCEYMRVTGIWQTVWLEAVGSTFVRDFVAEADPETGVVHLRARVDGPDQGLHLSAVISREGRDLARGQGDVVDASVALSVSVPNPTSWFPAHPALYDLDLSLVTAQGTEIDRVHGYAGFRKVTIHDGMLHLNSEPFFLMSALDQGYYPQSLYTPPTDRAMQQDVEWAKQYGLNSIRKHQIVAEPRFYYWCDRLGLPVWGEMADWGADLRQTDDFLRQWGACVRRNINHPSIITWVPTNERTQPEDEEYIRIKVRIYQATKDLDRTRPVIDTSGYCHTQTDITDLHVNTRGADGWRNWWQGWRRSITATGNAIACCTDRPTYSNGFRHQGQPVVISEAGNFIVAEFPPEGPWKAHGYPSPYHSGSIATVREFVAVYREYFLALTAAPECAGFSYVQLYDVEGEVNGYLTYSRKPKIPANMIAEVHDEVLRARAAIHRDRAD